jgi:pSer/pThr/pTyr-binding forkhead associated (FHA) protein
MALLELGGKRFPIPVGELAVGSDPACAVVVQGPGVLARHALIQGQAEGPAVIRKAAAAADILINGVRLGAEPTPLLHGDKIGLGGHELTVVDERRGGSTQFVQTVNPTNAPAPGPVASQAGPATARTGGRLVSLTDGREYVVAGRSLVFGREAGCDVVVAGKDVSRRHAEILAGPQGYLLVDSSTNGTFVNEARVQGQRLLARGDVVRIGEENFRFYADRAAVPAEAPPMPPSPPAPAPAAAAAPSARPPAGPSGPLATLLVKQGPLKGQRFELRTPATNIGRADYNDVVLPDPSVSAAHAKLQRREGVWLLVDLDSTNGSFVDEERVRGEAALGPGTTLRLGDVPLLFAPTDDALGVAKGGGTVAFRAAAAPPAPGVPERRSSRPPAQPAPPPPPAPRPPAGRRAPKPPPPARTAPAGRGGRGGPRGAAPPPEPKGKGCAAAVVVWLVGALGVVTLAHWILA